MANVTGWYAEVSYNVVVPRMNATAVMKPPNVSVNSAINILVPRMSATAIMPTPALVVSTNVAVPRMSATAAMPTPAVSNALNVSVTVPRMEATAQLKVPGMVVSGDVAVPRMAATAAMAAPAVAVMNGVTYTDNFNRSNASTLGASWNTDTAFGSSFTINSNAAVTTTFAGNLYTLPMSTGDNQITLVMKGSPVAGEGVSIFARLDNNTSASGSATAVTATLAQSDKWQLSRYAGDPTGVLTTGNQSWADGDTVTFSAVGATLTIKKNGSTILTTGGATDLAAGYVGFIAFSGGSSFGFDSFTAQDI